MAVIDIGQPSWRYDTVAKTLLLTFTEPCPKDELNPAAWRPAWDYQLTLPMPGTVVKVAHQDPNAVVDGQIADLPPAGSSRSVVRSHQDFLK